MDEKDRERLEYIYRAYDMHQFSMNDLLERLERKPQSNVLFKGVLKQEDLDKYLKSFVPKYLDYMLGTYKFQFTDEGVKAIKKIGKHKYSKEELAQKAMETVYLKFQMERFARRSFLKHVVDKLRKDEGFVASWGRYFGDTGYSGVDQVGNYLREELKYLKRIRGFAGRKYYKIDDRKWMPPEELGKKIRKKEEID